MADDPIADVDDDWPFILETSEVIDRYCRIWRRFFPIVAGWDESQTEKWIEEMWLEMPPDDVFHELPSTWAVWAIFPSVNGVSHEVLQNARNQLLGVIQSQNTLTGFEDFVDWQLVGDAYRRLQTMVSQNISQ